MDSNPAQKPIGQWQRRELRYSLKDLLEAVALLRATDAYGAEKLRQSDISHLFQTRNRSTRAAPRP